MDLEQLLTVLKTVQIANSFNRYLRKKLEEIRASSRVVKLDGPAELKERFFDERVYIGNTVQLRGRISQFCPVYFPVAYSPQAMICDPATNARGTIYNPAPTSIFTQSAQGATLAFLFEIDARETPRLVSPYHPDRTQSIPFHLADPGIPVLLDAQGEAYFEELVEITGTLVRLDSVISDVIASSQEEAVRLYYHTFYNSEFFPSKGYILDARSTSGGAVRPLMQAASFHTSVAVEFRYETGLGSNDIEEIIADRLKASTPHNIGPVRYQPAYYTPPGYRIVQRSLGNLVVHIAPEMGVLNVATLVDTNNPDREAIFKYYLPNVTAIINAFRKEDPKVHFELLFASDREFGKRIGIRPVR